MATNFDRWEKDPFFGAADEIQESTDRMESAYRAWIREKDVVSDIWNREDLTRDLRTALGTAKWQLEEFQGAVKSSYVNGSEDTAKNRHSQFAVAISNKISEVEASLMEESRLDGKDTVPWVRLDEGECNELALFLSGPSPCKDRTTDAITRVGEDGETSLEHDKKTSDCSSSSCISTEWGFHDTKLNKVFGHRRTASACADMEAWKISVLDGGHCQNMPSKFSSHKVPSFSGFLSTLDSASKAKWPKNSFRKLKLPDFKTGKDISLLDSSPVQKCSAPCYEKSKSHLDRCDNSCQKQLHGWYGAVRRHLHRSKYDLLRRRPIHVTMSLLFFMCLIFFVGRRAMR